MSDNNNEQWFNQDNARPRKKPTGKKPFKPQAKAPVDPARKGPPAQRTTAPSGKRPQKPAGKRPAAKGNNVPGRPTNGNTKAVRPQTGKPQAGRPQSVNPQGGKPSGTKPSKVKRPAGKKPLQNKKPVKEAIARDPAIPPKDAKPTPNEIRKQSSRRKALINSVIAVAVVLAGIAILLFVVHHLFDYFAVKPNLEFVTNGNIEHTIGSRAVIVRNENVVMSDHGGDFVTQAAEGSRVAAGQNIAMVVPSDMQSVVDNLRNTQSQISDVQQELIAQGASEGAEVIYSDIDQSLSPIINMLRLDSIDGNLSELSSYASSISVLLNQREIELEDLDFEDERLRVLRSDERGYESQLESRASVVNAPEPGIVSFKLDGLETVLTYEVLLNADAGTIGDYINSAVGVINSDFVVEAGDAVARIASNEQQYIACFLNESDAPSSAFEVGTQHTVIVGSEGLSIGKCIVERLTPTSNGNYLVVFSTTRYVEDLLDVRSADIEVVITETRGLRVPVTSLVNPDYSRGVASIYINDQGFCVETGVLIEDYDREFAIIKPMGDGTVPNLQTVYITNPSSVSPGDQVS